MKKHILITGATGMIGKRLLTSLCKEGHRLSILSRKPKKIRHAQSFVWDVDQQRIDPQCLKDVDTIIHLAGEQIAEKKWTRERKQQIIDSRVKSTQLLYRAIRETNAPVRSFISASAVGYYGNRGEEILLEGSGHGEGFMADCCRLWEEAADEGKSLGIRVVKLRLGFIMGPDEGVLASLDKPIRFFVGAALGSGRQWVPWVHLDDVVSMFSTAVSNAQMIGAYNACAPFPVTNKTLTHEVARALHRPVWPINVPEKVLEMILGKMSIIVLMSTNTSAQRLLDEGFRFKFTQLEDALADIYKK